MVLIVNYGTTQKLKKAPNTKRRDWEMWQGWIAIKQKQKKKLNHCRSRTEALGTKHSLVQFYTWNNLNFCSFNIFKFL